MKTANLAIVFTDIKGFTERTSHQTHEENERLLQIHSDLLTPLFRAFGGKVIKSIGDAFLVTFESPTQAVLSGVAIQDRLWQHNRSAKSSEQLDVRIAINVGEVRLDANDVFGEPVNIAARVEGITEAGEVYFTEAVYLAMNKAEVPSAEVGYFELKGIPGMIRVFRVPKSYYRVEAPLEKPPPEDQPPFGNLGLGKVPDLERKRLAELSSSAATAAAAIGNKAAELGGQIAKTTQAITGQIERRKLTPWLKRGLIGLGALIVVVFLAGLIFRTPVDRAIAQVKRAAPEQRDAAVDAARKLIAAEEDKDPGRAELDRGRLEEAVGAPYRAVEHYENAFQQGKKRAVRRLIALLRSPRCRVRAKAAEALGELQFAGARRPLERLAEDGGEGDGDKVLFFGCNSKQAAKDALEKLP